MAQYAGKDSIDYPTAKFAAETHCIMTPPDAQVGHEGVVGLCTATRDCVGMLIGLQKSVPLAKVHNSRNIGWPLGKAVKVPLRQVAHLTAVRDADVSIFAQEIDGTVPADSRMIDLSQEPEDIKMTGVNSSVPAAVVERPAATHIDLVAHSRAADQKRASEQRVSAYFHQE
jgi:hypothetical protein